MMRATGFSVEASSVSPAGHASRSQVGFSATSAIRIGGVVLAGLFLANCANDQVARRGKSKEIGAFSHPKYGNASPRVVAEGEDVPKGGGRQLIGKTYSVAGKRYTPYEKPVGYTQIGTASWYGEAFHGRRTANGEVYDRHGISAAHPTMPLPAYARVTNVLNNRSIVVRVNDRGPYHGGRVMDVSQKTADALAFRHLGTARIKVEYLGQASLAGSDDRSLLATLRTDGQPAAIPGTSAPTMVASTRGVATDRTPVADLDQGDARQPVREQPVLREAAPAPVVRAYAEPARPVGPANAALAAVSLEEPAAVRGTRLPPSRPFDLDTIANAGTPVRASAGPRTIAPRQPAMASLYTPPERPAAERIAAGNPLRGSLTTQNQRPLSRD